MDITIKSRITAYKGYKIRVKMFAKQETKVTHYEGGRQIGIHKLIENVVVKLTVGNCAEGLTLRNGH